MNIYQGPDYSNYLGDAEAHCKKIKACEHHQKEHQSETFMRIFPLVENMEVEEIIKKEADYFKFDVSRANRKFIPFQVKIIKSIKKTSEMFFRLYSIA